MVDKIKVGTQIIANLDKSRLIPEGTKLVITKIEDNESDTIWACPRTQNGNLVLRTYFCEEIGDDITIQIILYDYNFKPPHEYGVYSWTILHQGWSIYQ